MSIEQQAMVEMGREIELRGQAIKLLRDALIAVKEQLRAPGEGHSEYFERQAERFYRESGWLAPGKSEPLEMRSVDHYKERQEAWEAFFNKPWTQAINALAATEQYGTKP